MQKIKSNKGFKADIDGFHFEFKKDREYICPDSFLDAIRTASEVSKLISSEEFVNLKAVGGKINYTGKKLLITRTGGRGDFHFILRSVQEIKNNFKDVHITFCCGSKYFDSTKMMFEDLVDEFKKIPCTLKDYEECDYFFTFEGYIESNQLAKTVNAFELMAMKFFIELKGDHSMPLKIYEKYNSQARELVNHWRYDISKGRRVVAIQLKASAIMRTYPFDYTAKLIENFNAIGYQVLLLESKDTIEEITARSDYKNLDILLPYNKDIKGSFELSSALLKYCRLFIGPDSIFTYVSDSIGTDCLIIYSPFSSRLRAEKLNVFALDTLKGCYNCCTHQEQPCNYSKDIFSPCIKKLTPEIVYSTSLKILNKEV